MERPRSEDIFKRVTLISVILERLLKLSFATWNWKALNIRITIVSYFVAEKNCHIFVASLA